MSRPSWEDYFFNILHQVATRGTCKRRQVGALIIKDRRIISTGYNGPPSGQPHCDEAGCNLSEVCQKAIHAELNAICQAAKFGQSLDGATIFVECIPCRSCSQAIIASGIKEVYYENEYSYGEYLKLLVDSGIKVTKRSDI